MKIYPIIENQGFENADNLNVSLFVDDNYVSSKIINLPSISQKTINFTWIAQNGLHNLTIRADPENKINETNDANNELTQEILVKFNCDLNNDEITIHDYNDLMTAYKCFLGINKNCNINYQDWTLLKQEYNCFINNKFKD